MNEAVVVEISDHLCRGFHSLVMMKMFSMPKLIAAVLSYEVLQLEYLDRLDSHELWVASS
jgi:hypothetical protein